MSDELVTVATFLTLPEAEAARLMLETEGVPAMLSDAEVVSMDWLLGNAVGNIKLVVPSAFVGRASELLDRVNAERRRRREEAEDDPEAAWADDGTTACLACGTPMPEGEEDCPACGWSYNEGQEGR